MRATTQYQPLWMEQNKDKPRYVMWLVPEEPMDRFILNKLVKKCKSAGWTGLHDEMVIVTFPK